MTLYFLFALMVGTRSSPTEEVSARCTVAVSQVVGYLKSTAGGEGSEEFLSAFSSEYSLARCINSRKDPARTFVVLGRTEKLKIFHHDVFLVDSRFRVTKVRDIPCDEHPVKGICG